MSRRLLFLVLPAAAAGLWLAWPTPAPPTAAPPVLPHPLCHDCPPPAAVPPYPLPGLAGRVPAGDYRQLTPSRGLPRDWRAYDWLRLRVHNPSDTPQRLVVEIRDAHTTDYWSRVNWYTVAPPGTADRYVPLDAGVGEKLMIREPRRLDRTAITRLVVSGVDAGADLDLREAALEAEPPPAPGDAHVIRLDPGPGPVFPGFTSLGPDERYDPARGYGFAPDAVVRAVDRRHPDALLRDHVAVRGGLSIDLPPGRYHLWMMLRDPGYWTSFPHFVRRRVEAEGEALLDETGTVDDLWAEYWRFADVEDLPGDDVWRRYVADRHRPHRFVVAVSDGRLDLRFDGEPAPTLSALVVFPETAAAAGEAFLERLAAQRRRAFERTHGEARAPAAPAPPGDEPVLLFRRSAGAEVLPEARPAPGEAATALDLALARGEAAPLTLSLLPRTDAVLRAVEIDLPGLGVEPRVVRYKVVRESADGHVYRVAPRLLDPLRVPLALPAGVARRLWLRVRAPVEGPAGVTQGSLRLVFDHGTRTLPVTVTVHPFTLPPADLHLGYLGAAPAYPPSPFPEVEARRRREFPLGVALLADHGLTAVTGGLGGPRQAPEGWALDDVAASMAVFGRHFRAPVLTYLGLAPAPEPADDAALAELLAALRTAGASAGWPPIVHVVGDEPPPDAVGEVLARSRRLHRLDSEARTAVFTSLLGRSDPRAALADEVDLVLLNHHDEAALRGLARRGRAFALYNQATRYHRGVYLDRLRALGGQGHYQFAFSSVGADPYDALDAREDDLCAVYTHPSGALIPTVDLALFALAVDDLRYLRALDRVIEEAPPSRPRDEAAAWLRRVREAMPLGHAASWDDARLEALRREAAAHLRALAAP